MVPELRRQLTVTTSSLKKRKVSRNPARDRDSANTPSPLAAPADTVIPSGESNEDDDDCASFSFSVASNSSFTTAQLGDKETLSSLPPRLQTHSSSLVSADYASSAASSPSAAYAELSIDSEPASATTETGPALHQSSARTRSPIRHPRRAIMSGDGDCNRSSSPLKRRASSMDREHNESETNQSVPDYPRAMSVDAPDGPGYAQNPDAGKFEICAMLEMWFPYLDVTLCQCQDPPSRRCNYTIIPHISVPHMPAAPGPLSVANWHPSISPTAFRATQDHPDSPASFQRNSCSGG